MQPSDSHTDFKVRLENRSTRDRKLVGRSEERRVGKECFDQSVDLGGRRIIKKKFFKAEDGIRD